MTYCVFVFYFEKILQFIAAVLVYFPARPKVPPTALSEIPRMDNIKSGVKAMITNRSAPSFALKLIRSDS